MGSKTKPRVSSWSRERSVADYGGDHSALKAARRAAEQLTTQEHAPYSLVAHNFFEQEAARYSRLWRNPEKWESAFKAACQALFWAIVLDRVLLTEPGGGGYKKFRDGHEFAPIARGIRFARDRVAHQFQPLFSFADGVSALPFRGDPVFYELCWLRRTEFKGKLRQDVEGAKCFDEHVAGKPVRLTFRALRKLFAEFLHERKERETRRRRPTRKAPDHE